MNSKWFQMWVSHPTAKSIVEVMTKCDPILQRFACVPKAPDGIPVIEADGTIEVRGYNEAGFFMAKQYLRDEGFVIEREQENET